MTRADFELGIKENSGLDVAGLGDLRKFLPGVLRNLLTRDVTVF